jgi:hypothetical protein
VHAQAFARRKRLHAPSGIGRFDREEMGPFTCVANTQGSGLRRWFPEAGACGEGHHEGWHKAHGFMVH